MKRKARADLSQLLPASFVENGALFETGVPVTFSYVRRTEKSPNFGKRYQQDIEPHGRYMITDPGGELMSGWERGEVTFERPLVMLLHPEQQSTSSLYDERSWKARLADYYGKTGKALSKAIAKDGYDAVVTLDSHRGVTSGTREIVDLTMFHTGREKNPREHAWLALPEIERWEHLMRCWGVSEVARSSRGFLRQYREAGGDPDGLSPIWRRRRNAFVARHLAQMKSEPLFVDGLPSRRHLALVAWAYSPGEARLGRTRAPSPSYCPSRKR